MTPAIKVLEGKAIIFTIHEYLHESSTSSYGLEAANALNVSADRVFKTLVTEANNGQLIVAIVPVSDSLSLKQLATTVGVKKINMADKSKVQNTSGYVIGGVSPIGQKKKLKTVIDRSAFEHETIFVSAGKRGMDVELSPSDLQRLCNANTASIATKT